MALIPAAALPRSWRRHRTFSTSLSPVRVYPNVRNHVGDAHRVTDRADVGHGCPPLLDHTIRLQSAAGRGDWLRSVFSLAASRAALIWVKHHDATEKRAARYGKPFVLHGVNLVVFGRAATHALENGRPGAVLNTSRSRRS